MTDNEIIKSLNGNISNAKRCDCKVWSIEVYKLENVFDLINRQKAEIERLKCEMGKLLPKDCSYAMQMEVSNKLESQIKSEAIKEFAEKLKENYCFTDRWGKIITKSTVDNLVKEMMEVETNQRKEDEKNENI